MNIKKTGGSKVKSTEKSKSTEKNDDFDLILSEFAAKSSLENAGPSRDSLDKELQIPVHEQFTEMPKGLECDYVLEGQIWRSTSEEAREAEKVMSEELEELRRAGEVHRRLTTMRQPG